MHAAKKDPTETRSGSGYSAARHIFPLAPAWAGRFHAPRHHPATHGTTATPPAAATVRIHVPLLPVPRAALSETTVVQWRMGSVRGPRFVLFASLLAPVRDRWLQGNRQELRFVWHQTRLTASGRLRGGSASSPLASTFSGTSIGCRIVRSLRASSSPSVACRLPPRAARAPRPRSYGETSGTHSFGTPSWFPSRSSWWRPAVVYPPL